MNTLLERPSFCLGHEFTDETVAYEAERCYDEVADYLAGISRSGTQENSCDNKIEEEVCKGCDGVRNAPDMCRKDLRAERPRLARNSHLEAKQVDEEA